MRLIGRREFATLPMFDMVSIEAKVDTGAYTSSLHCDAISVSEEQSGPVLYLTVSQMTNGLESTKRLRFEKFTQKKIKNSFGEMEERYVIRTLIHIGHKKIWSSFSLSNRDSMRYPLLIGRRLLKRKFLVDVNQIHTGGIRLTKALNVH